MDDPQLDSEKHLEALRGLERINAWSGSARLIWPLISALARENLSVPLRVLDIATGGGDIPITLQHRARQSNLSNIVFAGCDLSERAMQYARERAARVKATIDFFPLDVLHQSLPPDFDVVMASLFTHHLDAEQVVELLKRMGQAARRMVIINDLRRSRGGLLLAQLATRILSRSDVVHTDGPLSVHAAYTIHEMREMAEQAGLTGAKVERCWPCRLRLVWTRKTVL